MGALHKTEAAPYELGASCVSLTGRRSWLLVLLRLLLVQGLIIQLQVTGVLRWPIVLMEQGLHTKQVLVFLWLLLRQLIYYLHYPAFGMAQWDQFPSERCGESKWEGLCYLYLKFSDILWLLCHTFGNAHCSLLTNSHCL